MEDSIIKKLLLEKKHRVRPGGSYKKASITIHSTGNDTSTAQNERDWLDNPKNRRDASWHYVVERDTIIQAIPDQEAAWHCGVKEGNCTSIGIELVESGDRLKVLETGAKFTAQKLKELGLLPENMKRHYDWTGKNCPRILIDPRYIKKNLDWNWFIERVQFYFDQINRKEKEKMEKQYHTLEELPEWAKPTIKKLIDKGYLQGTISGLGLSETAVRIFVIHDRMGLYQ